MKTLAFIFGLICGHSLSILHVNLNGFFPTNSFCHSFTGENSSSEDDNSTIKSMEILHSNETEKTAKKPRILCWILSTPDKKNKPPKSRHAALTWGRKCDKLLLMSSKKDKNNETIHLPVDESYQTLWGKTREAFKYIHKHYSTQFDWVLKADDDTFVIMENLRLFLSSQNPRGSLYFGCHLKKYAPNGYHTGGAGYVLSMPAVRRLVKEGFSNPKKCSQKNWGTEDTEISICLGNLGIKPSYSRDSFGREMFFLHHPNFFTVPPKFALNNQNFIWDRFTKPTQRGLDALSKTPISFHKISTEDMYTIQYFLYRLKIHKVL